MTRHDKLLILIGTITTALVILVIVFAVRDCNAKAKCRDGGGHVEEYDCHTSTICTTTNKVTICNPVESCKWRCVKPEAQ